MTRLLRSSLRKDERGAAVIELALTAPILAALLIGMVDLGRGYSTKLQLEQSAQRAIEKVMNGQADRKVAAALKTEAAATAGVDESAVVVDFWLECNGTRQSTYDMACPTGQIYKRYLSVQIQKVFTPMFRTKFAGSRSDGTYLLTGRTSVRTQ